MEQPANLGLPIERESRKSPHLDAYLAAKLQTSQDGHTEKRKAMLIDVETGGENRGKVQIN